MKKLIYSVLLGAGFFLSLTIFNQFRSFTLVLFAGAVVLILLNVIFRRLKFQPHLFAFWLVPTAIMTLLNGIHWEFFAYLTLWLPIMLILQERLLNFRCLILVSSSVLSVFFVQLYAYQLITKDGKKSSIQELSYELRGLEGNKVLFFWSKRCGPCKRYVPLVNELAKDQNHMVAIETVFRGDSSHLVFDKEVIAIRARGRYASITDKGFPQIILLDENDRVRSHFTGYNKDIDWYVNWQIRRFMNER